MVKASETGGAETMRPHAFRSLPRPAGARAHGPGLVARLAAEPGPEEAELIAALQRVLFGDAPLAAAARGRTAR
jgi:hypothetical protein